MNNSKLKALLSLSFLFLVGIIGYFQGYGFIGFVRYQPLGFIILLVFFIGIYKFLTKEEKACKKKK